MSRRVLFITGGSRGIGAGVVAAAASTVVVALHGLVTVSPATCPTAAPCAKPAPHTLLIFTRKPSIRYGSLHMVWTDAQGRYSVHLLTATWLVQHKIKAVGIDTPSMDYGQSKNFKTHQILLGASTPGFENVANMNLLPVKGAYIIALPMKIKNGSGGPLRIIAWVKH